MSLFCFKLHMFSLHFSKYIFQSSNKKKFTINSSSFHDYVMKKLCNMQNRYWKVPSNNTDDNFQPSNRSPSGLRRSIVSRFVEN